MQILDFFLRLGAALLMGAAVGLERQWRQRIAGARTNTLVAAGASAFVMCAFMVRDTSRSEARVRTELQAMSQSPLTLAALRSEDIEGTNKMKVTPRIRGMGHQDQALEQLVVRLYLEAGVSSVSWAVQSEVLE